MQSLIIIGTLVLLAREGALAPCEDPEHKVGHAKGEGDDGVAEDDGEEDDQQHHPSYVVPVTKVRYKVVTPAKTVLTLTLKTQLRNNTSLAALVALAHRLQRRTACNT